MCLKLLKYVQVYGGKEFTGVMYQLFDGWS
jgi:hypothetical protein